MSKKNPFITSTSVFWVAPGARAIFPPTVNQKVCLASRVMPIVLGPFQLKVILTKYVVESTTWQSLVAVFLPRASSTNSAYFGGPTSRFHDFWGRDYRFDPGLVKVREQPQARLLSDGK